jgi:anti-anti-sigma factor
MSTISTTTLPLSDLSLEGRHSARAEHPQRFRVGVVSREGVALVRIAGELDRATGELLRPVLDRVLDSAPRRLVLDLAGADFIDGAGARVLLEACKRVADGDGEAVIRSANRLARLVLRLVGLDRVVLD